MKRSDFHKFQGNLDRLQDLRFLDVEADEDEVVPVRLDKAVRVVALLRVLLWLLALLMLWFLANMEL